MFEAEIIADGRTVWVNGPDGMCFGRFSRFGIDVHKSFAAQASGLGQCLDCTHSIPGPLEWERFRDGMKSHHGVTVPSACKPRWLAVETAVGG